MCGCPEGVPRPTPGSCTEGYRPLDITINHWQRTAIAEKEPLPSIIPTAKEIYHPLLRCLYLEHPNKLTFSKQNSPIHARHF